MLALLAGLGCQVLIERLPRAARVLPLALPAFLLATGWRAFDRSRYRIAEAFAARGAALAAARRAPLASDDNVLFVLIYLHLVEGRRPDVDLVLQGVGEADLPPLRFDPDRDPLFFTHHPNWNLPALEIVPIGIVFRRARGQPAPGARASGGPARRRGRSARAEGLPHAEPDRALPLHARRHLRADATGRARARELAAAARAAPENDVLFYNLGLIYRRNGLLDEAIAAFERADAINPRHLPSGTRARASDRLAELAAERRP